MRYPHWQYYLSLLGDLQTISRYVEFTEDNYAAYSVELVRLLLAACSEIDVVSKLLCNASDPEAPARNIDEYRAILLSRYPKLPEVSVSLRRYQITIGPWEEWARGGNPRWWRAYNNVKHERNEHFPDANLINVLSAMGALCILVCYLYPDMMQTGDPFQQSGLLFLDKQYRCGGHLLHNVIYGLPDISEPPT